MGGPIPRSDTPLWVLVRASGSMRFLVRSMGGWARKGCSPLELANCKLCGGWIRRGGHNSHSSSLAGEDTERDRVPSKWLVSLVITNRTLSYHYGFCGL